VLPARHFGRIADEIKVYLEKTQRSSSSSGSMDHFYDQAHQRDLQANDYVLGQGLAVSETSEKDCAG
jgi:hypothetical protein